jgi:hypothetical protein
VHGSGALPGRRIDQHHLSPAGLSIRTLLPAAAEAVSPRPRQRPGVRQCRRSPRAAWCAFRPDGVDEGDRAVRATRSRAMKSRRGPECLGVRASWPPVVAFVMMDERPAPRCKRRRYRCAVLAQPLRRSTVDIGVHIPCVCPTRATENSAQPSLPPAPRLVRVGQRARTEANPARSIRDGLNRFGEPVTACALARPVGSPGCGQVMTN